MGCSDELRSSKLKETEEKGRLSKGNGKTLSVELYTTDMDMGWTSEDKIMVEFIKNLLNARAVKEVEVDKHY